MKNSWRVNRELFRELKRKKAEMEQEKFSNTNAEKEYWELRDKIIMDNLYLADRIASLSFLKELVDSEEDLLQIARESLIELIDDFEVEKEPKFIPYAYRYIFLKTIRKVYKSKGSITPNQLIHKIKRIEDLMLKELGIHPTNKKLADMLGITEEQVIKLKKYEKFTNAESIEHRKKNNSRLLAEMNDGEKTVKVDGEYYIDGVPLTERGLEEYGDNTNDPVQVVLQEEEKIKIKSALNKLKPTYKELIKMKYGFENYIPKGCTTLAKRFKTSRQNIHPKLKKATKQLGNDLKDYYNDEK